MKMRRLGLLAAFAAATLAMLVVAAGTVAATGAQKKVAKIAYASPGKANDYGWNQQGAQSARAAARATGVATVEVSDGIGYDNTESVLRRLAQKEADLIIAQASGFNTIAPRIAQQFRVPVLTYDKPQNRRRGLVADIETTSQQGAYLAGVLAANTTKTNKLGIVVSAADTNWYKQSGGFAAGARSVNPDVEFLFAQISQGGYEDAAGGKRVTRSVIAGGADVVFGMGDGSSFGMLQAVETAKPPAGADKVWFIDVIGDKTKIDKKGVLLSSVLWDFTKVFSQAVRDINAGSFGTHNYFLTVKNGIGLLETKYIPADVLAEIRTAQRGIISKTIKIPLTPTKGAVDRILAGS